MGRPFSVRLSAPRWLVLAELILLVLPLAFVLVLASIFVTILTLGFTGDFVLLFAIYGNILGLVCALILGSKFLISSTWPRTSFGIVWVGLLGGLLSGLYVTFTVFPFMVLFVLVSGRWSIAVMNEQFPATRKAGERYYASDLEILLRRAALPIWLVICGLVATSVIQSDSLAGMMSAIDEVKVHRAAGEYPRAR